VSEIQPIKHPLTSGIKAQRGIEFLLVLGVKRYQLYADRPGRLLCYFELRRRNRVGKVHQIDEASSTGRNLMEELEPLGSQLGQYCGNARAIPAGFREAFRQASCDWIAR
jgi:hypothetical protein